jgi:hypothetical protein
MHLRSIVTLVLLAAAGLARAASLNVITEVGVRDEGGTVILTIKGSKPPSFTTFSMADPPRFVIDLSEAKFQGVPEDVLVQDGVVNVVKNLSYGSDATSIARVVVAFAVDVDPPDVQTQGTALVVRVARPAGAGAPVAKQDDGAAKAAEQAARAEAERKAQEETARADAEKKAQDAARADAEKKARDDAAQAEAEQKAQEKAARAEAEQKAQDAARVDAEKKARDDAARAEAEQKAQDAARADAEKKTRDDAARADAEKKAQEQAARAEAEQKAVEAREQERQAALAKAEAERAAKATQPAPEPERSVDPTPVAAEPSPERAAATYRFATAPSAQVREVGFQQLPGASRVFVRTSVTPRFTIQDVGENTIRVSLENTRATRRNDLRFLDTSFFHSAIAMVTPKRVGSGYVLDIRLKERVPFQQKIEGDMLAIDFERPASAPAATAQPAPAAEAVPAALEGDAPGALPAAQ